MDALLSWKLWLLALALLTLAHVLGGARARRDGAALRTAQRGYILAEIAISLLVSVAISVATFALTKIKGVRPARPQVPTNREGARVRRIYGTVWIDDPVQCAMKFLSPEPIKKKVKGPLGIGSKKVTTGYHYHWVMHFCWCGPVDALLGMRAGDVVVTTRRVAVNKQIQISKPDLWGGSDGEGGIEGPMDVLFGREGQTPSDYLIAEFGAQQPARLGKFCTTFRGGRYGAGSANPRPPSVKVYRALTDWLDDDPWYPEKASLPFVGRLLDIVRVSWKQSSWHAGGEDRARMGIVLLDLEGSVLSEVWAPMIGTPDHVWTARSVQSYTHTGTAVVRIYMEMERHSGENNDGYIDSIVVTLGGDVIDIINPGAEDGTTGWISDIGGLVARFGDPDPAEGSAYFSGGEEAATRAYQDIVAINVSMNPAHILYDSLTHPDMLGEPVALINDASFRAAADKLYSESFGLCPDYDEDEETVEEFQQRICNVIGAGLSQSLVDGLYYLDLIRGAGEEELPVITDADVKEAAITQVQPIEAVNVIRVEWFDPVTKTTRLTAPVASLSAIASAGRQVTQTRSYKEVPREGLALRLARRDLNAASMPLHKIELKLLHRFRGLRQGCLVRLQLLEDGIADMVCVVGAVGLGDRLNNVMSLTLLQNAFDLPATVHVGTSPDLGTPPSTAPVPPEDQLAVEAPYVELASSLSAGDLAVLPAAAGYVLTAATQPGTAVNYDLYSKIGSEAYDERDVGDWTPSALVVEAADHLETDFTLSDASLLDRVVVGSWALWSGEIVSVDAIDAGTGAVQLGRGCGDTPPVEHEAVERIWFVGDWAGVDPRQYVDADVVDAKLLTRTTSGALALEDAPAVSLTLDQRAARPYAPGNVKLNGESYPISLVGDVELTWAHRDRLAQGNALIDVTAASIGPEAGVTYSWEVYNDDTDELLDSDSGIASDTADLSDVPLAGNNRLELWAVRGGLSSWRRHIVRFAYPQILGDVGRGVAQLDYLAELSTGVSITTPVAWSILSGTLPPGLHLISDGSPDAQIAGVPLATASGDYSATIRAKGASGISSDRAITISIGTVVALLHMEGSNGGTTFTDETGRTWTRSGATTSNTKAKFGSTSLKLDGSAGDYLETADANPDLRFNSAAWTMDFWFNMNTSQPGTTWAQMIGKRLTSSLHPFVSYVREADTKLDMVFQTTTTTYGATNVLTTRNAWHHWAMTKDGSNLYCFLDGVLVFSGAMAGTVVDSTDSLRLGLNNDGNSATKFWGYIDELRILQGVAAWTAAFTPPAAAYVYPQTSPVVAVNGSLPNGVAATAYSSLTGVTIHGSGTPFSVSVSAGALPSGWSAAVNANHVEVTGPGVAAGEYTFTLKVEDAALNAAYLPVTVRVV